MRSTRREIGRLAGVALAVALGGLAAVAALAGPGANDTGVTIVLSDDSRLQGKLVGFEGRVYRVRIGGQIVTIPAEDVAKIVFERASAAAPAGAGDRAATTPPSGPTTAATPVAGSAAPPPSFEVIAPLVFVDRAGLLPEHALHLMVHEGAAGLPTLRFLAFRGWPEGAGVPKGYWTAAIFSTQVHTRQPVRTEAVPIDRDTDLGRLVLDGDRPRLILQAISRIEGSDAELVEVARRSKVPAMRLAAVELLVERRPLPVVIGGALVVQVLTERLRDEEPEVRAAAAGRLREALVLIPSVARPGAAMVARDALAAARDDVDAEVRAVVARELARIAAAVDGGTPGVAPPGPADSARLLLERVASTEVDASARSAVEAALGDPRASEGSILRRLRGVGDAALPALVRFLRGGAVGAEPDPRLPEDREALAVRAIEALGPEAHRVVLALAEAPSSRASGRRSSVAWPGGSRPRTRSIRSCARSPTTPTMRSRSRASTGSGR